MVLKHHVVNINVFTAVKRTLLLSNANASFNEKRLHIYTIPAYAIIKKKLF
jgi:hypothetical protein